MKVKKVCSGFVGICFLCLELVCFGQSPENAQQLHRRALDLANASVDRAISRADHDSLRPIFHVTAASRFINDPNGPVYFAGEYHIFFQHLPFWGDSISNRPVWGHAVSKDLVHWAHLPIALAPTQGSYDAGAIASGCCVVYQGVPTIIYTGVNPQTQCLATSHDNLRTWTKDSHNPVIPGPPALEGLRDGFRDPCAWREGNKWYLLVGSAFQVKGGTVLLYTSDDLHHWEFLGPLCTGMGERCIQWECPAFFPLGDKHVLIVSPLYSDEPGLRGMVEYAAGNYHNHQFEPDHWQPVDLGGPTVYYAPNSFEDAGGRRILWGWIMAARPPQAGWWGSLSLPRVVTLASDNTLQYAPIPELNALRYDKKIQEKFVIQSDHEWLIRQECGMHYEVLMEAEIAKVSQLEIRIGRSTDGHNFMRFAYDAGNGQLIFGDKKADFHLNPGEKLLSIRLFVDGNVGEAYINGRACFTNVLPFNKNSTGISLMASGGDVQIRQMASWKMGSIW